MRFFILIFAMCLAGCFSSHDITITRLPHPRVVTADYTAGESAVCEIHHVQMERTVVPIGYGLILPDAKAQARYAASTNAFPHAETFVLGGCVVSDDSPKSAVIYTCPACKKAASRWDSDYAKR
jgi:hypothetical protein